MDAYGRAAAIKKKGMRELLTQKLKNKRLVKKGQVKILAIYMMLFLMVLGVQQVVLAAGAKDAVEEVAKRNSRSWQTITRSEKVPGGSLTYYEAWGKLGKGEVRFIVDEPVGNTPIQSVIQFNYGAMVEDVPVKTTPMTGYEMREYVMSDGVGVWFVLPNYMVVVEISETGNSKDRDLQLAKNFAQELMEALRSRGLIKQAASVSQPAEPVKEKATAQKPGTVTGKPMGEPVEVAKITNVAAVYNQPTAPTTFSLAQPHLVTSIVTYHWNDGKGAVAGTIALKGSDEKVYGPWKASTHPGQGGVVNAYWEVMPNVVIPAGVYTIVDSDPATWSQNKQSGGRGMATVKATPHFQVNGDEEKKSVQGEKSDNFAGEKNKPESPAGVGSVGNIPGPSSTTEAIVGVTLPGLIATGLGALAGGGGCTPPGGTSLPSPGTGPLPNKGVPGDKRGQGVWEQTVNQLGRKRRQESDRDVLQEQTLIQEETVSSPDLTTKSMTPKPKVLVPSPSESPVESGKADGIFIEAGAKEPASSEKQGQPNPEIFIDTSAIENDSLSAILPGSAESSGQEAATASKGSADKGAKQAAKEELPKPYGEKGEAQEKVNKDTLKRSGYDDKGYNKAGFDGEGYDRNGFNKQGYNKEGYDKEGYNREGYDKQGRQQEGYDEYGYDRKGFNKAGFDKDGYDREGFNYEGYNRSGYDPWGYNKQGYDKEGYHWSGYNGDGYDRNGRHWSQNPYEGDSNPFNVLSSNAQRTFGEGKVIPHGTTEVSKINWQPKKPPLGEPYPKTLEKYGAKPWTDEPKNSVSVKRDPEDSGTIGPEDPMNTIKQHGADKVKPAGPLEKKETVGAEALGRQQDGEKRTLVGKTDGRSVEIEYDGKAGEWVNTETGNPIDPEKFEQWQEDLAQDRRQAAQDIEKMSLRQDSNSQAIDQSLSDWKRLEQMQKAVERHGIGDPGGPGNIDKAIQDLKDDMLAGNSVDQQRMEQLNTIIDNRITGQTLGNTGLPKEEDWVDTLGYALEANAASAKEVVTGEKADGSTSWAGMGARIAIGAATGGSSEYVMTVAEAMHRIKGSVDKGESDVRAVAKAVGQLILEEVGGEVISAAGGKAMQRFADTFPGFTQKAGDTAEKLGLAVAAGDQALSSKLGLISKQKAETVLADLAKRMDDMGADSLRKAFDDKLAGTGLKVASAEDMAKGLGKETAAEAGDLGKAVGKTADGVETPTVKTEGKVADAATEVERVNPSETDVLKNPKAIGKAEKALEKKMDTFNNLSEEQKQKLIREQAIYDEYRLQAEAKNWDLADKVQRGEKLSVEDVLKLKSDPAAMRNLKEIEKMEGLGRELGETGAIHVQKTFNETLESRIYEPSRKEVMDSLKAKYGEVKVETIRTPGKEYQDWDINTDNDIVVLRKAEGPHGTEWVEISRSEWENTYFKAYAKHSGFDPQKAASQFPEENWSRMPVEEQYRKWGELHGESPTDVMHPEGARDFSNQRTWALKEGELPGRHMVEATPQEVARGVETVTIGDRQMRPASAAELVQKRQGTLLDSEQLGMMEKYKINHYWEKGDIKSQTEAMEQLRKAASQARNLEQSYKDMGYKIADMPENMKKAVDAIQDNSLSPAVRAARLAELGYESPGTFVDKLTSRIGALRGARR